MSKFNSEEAPEDEIENLWECPVCNAEHIGPVIVCKRCECQILLLNKIKLTAYQLRKAGKIEESLRLYNPERNKNGII